MDILEAIAWLIKNPDKKVKEIVNGVEYYMWFNHQGFLRRSYVDTTGEVSFTGYTSKGNWQPISWEEDKKVIKYQKKINEIKQGYLDDKEFYEKLIKERKPMGV